MYNKMKKQELVELCESFESEIGIAEQDLEYEVEQTEALQKEVWELEEKIRCLENDSSTYERLILKIEELDPQFNRALDLTNNYLPKDYLNDNN